jgi:hypothetical protein
MWNLGSYWSDANGRFSPLAEPAHQIKLVLWHMLHPLNAPERQSTPVLV